MTLRDDLYRLIDTLPEAQLGDASTLLEGLRVQDAASQLLAVARDPEVEEWQREAIRASLAYADSARAKWVANEEVVTWLRSWGSGDERPPPSAKR